MKFKSDSTLYIVLGSIILSIAATALYMLGYFPNIQYCIMCGLMTVLIFLVYVMFVSIMIYICEYTIQNSVIPLIIGIFGVISTSALALSSALINSSKSTLLLFFVFSALLIFTVCSFYKLIIWIFYERSKRHK